MKLLIIPGYDSLPYCNQIKSLCSPAATALAKKAPVTLWELETACSSAYINAVVTDSPEVLSLLLKMQYGYAEKRVSIENYAGSIFKTGGGLEILILNSFKQLFSVPYGRFIASRYISKITRPAMWRKASPFVFSIPQSEIDFTQFLALAHSALALAIDIETIKDPLAIAEIGFTAINPDLSTRTITFEVNSMRNYEWMRALCEDTECPKIFQNGKYDIAYLLRYRIAPYNYILDTANLFHSWLAELPKDLAYIAAFCVRDSMYWKDLAKSQSRMEQLLYNGKDTWNTAEALITLLLEAPDWAINNYANLEFIAVHPSILAEATGLKADMSRMSAAILEQEAAATAALAEVRSYTNDNFNPSSPKQCLALIKALGHNVESSGESELENLSFTDPLLARISAPILSYRGIKKLLGSYLDPDKVFQGRRLLYAINPHGTDTGRNASKEHHFWTGMNMQNQPRGKEVKQCWQADPGFVIAENDLEQAESRGTAHISGCEPMIAAVTGERDFHSVNCSAFFGVPYEEIYDQVNRKTLKKALRDLAKRVNHGANYCMGALVLLVTMGLKAVYEARRLLGLPPRMAPLAVCEYLLRCFHKTYPELEGIFYPRLKEEILTTGLIRSRAMFHMSYGDISGWVRKCFSDPSKNKRAANSYVAHVPQNLNAMNLNLAFCRVFWEVWYPLREQQIFKLNGQIHDSILYQFRDGHEYLCEEVRRKMEIEITVTGYDGRTRSFSVPAAVKAGKNFNSRYWSETE